MDEFQGSSKLKLDAKGRLTVPAKYRGFVFPEGETQAVLALHLYEPCLVLYPMPAWVQVRESLNKLSNANRKHGQVKRRILGGAETVELDGSGRMPIGQMLRDKTNLSKDALIVGGGHCYEIWDAATYDAQDAALLASLTSDADALSESLEGVLL